MVLTVNQTVNQGNTAAACLKSCARGKLDALIHEVPINYQGCTIAEGKKIRRKDGIEAVYTLLARACAGGTRQGDLSSTPGGAANVAGGIPNRGTRIRGYRIIVVSGAPANETSHFLARVVHEVLEVQVAAVPCGQTQQDRNLFSVLRDDASAVGHALLRL